MPETLEHVRQKKALRKKSTELKLHIHAITDDLVWDIADGLRVRAEDVLNAHTVEVCVRNADGTVVWKRSDFLKKGV